MSLQMALFAEAKVPEDPNKVLVTSYDQFEKMMSQLNEASIVCFDFETSSTLR